MEYYSAIEINETMPFAATWMDLKIILNETSHNETSSISRVTIYSLDVLLSQFGTSLLFHVQF